MGKEVGFGIGELKVRGFCRRPARSASHRVVISRMYARTLQVPQLDRTMLRLRSAAQLGPLDFHTSTDHRTVLAVVEHDRVRSAVRCPSFGTSRALGIHSCFKLREESEDADNVCGAVHTTRIAEITDPEGLGER